MYTHAVYVDDCRCIFIYCTYCMDLYGMERMGVT